MDGSDSLLLPADPVIASHVVTWHSVSLALVIRIREIKAVTPAVLVIARPKGPWKSPDYPQPDQAAVTFRSLSLRVAQRRGNLPSIYNVKPYN